MKPDDRVVRYERGEQFGDLGTTAVDAFVDRNAMFKPALGCAHLSRAELESWNDNGYLVLKNVFAADEVHALFARAAEVFGDSDRYYHMGFSGETEWAIPEFVKLLDRPEIQKPVFELNGESKMFFSFLFHKQPHDSRPKPWHQDGIYWSGERGNSRLCLFVPLSEGRVDNGCIHVVPGTHRLGRLYHWPDATNPTNLTCDIRSLRDPVPVETEIGDVILLHSLTVHGSFDNRTDRQRINLGYHFKNVELCD